MYSQLVGWYRSLVVREVPDRGIRDVVAGTAKVHGPVERRAQELVLGNPGLPPSFATNGGTMTPRCSALSGLVIR